MNRHFGFGIALALAVLVALLVSVLFLLPECFPGEAQDACLNEKQQGFFASLAAGGGFTALAVAAHLKASRRAAFLAIMCVIVAPLAVRLAFSA